MGSALAAIRLKMRPVERRKISDEEIIERTTERRMAVNGSWSRRYSRDWWPKARASRVFLRCRCCLARVFKVDVTICERCGGAVKIIACIHRPLVVTRILERVERASSPQLARPSPKSTQAGGAQGTPPDFEKYAQPRAKVQSRRLRWSTRA